MCPAEFGAEWSEELVDDSSSQLFDVQGKFPGSSTDAATPSMILRKMLNSPEEESPSSSDCSSDCWWEDTMRVLA